MERSRSSSAAAMGDEIKTVRETHAEQSPDCGPPWDLRMAVAWPRFGLGRRRILFVFRYSCVAWTHRVSSAGAGGLWQYLPIFPITPAGTAYLRLRCRFAGAAGQAEAMPTGCMLLLPRPEDITTKGPVSSGANPRLPALLTLASPRQRPATKAKARANWFTNVDDQDDFEGRRATG